MSVEICSGDGSGRVSSENWTMRAGRRIDGDDDAIDGAGGRMRFEIEQRQRPQRPRIAHRRRQLQRPFVHHARLACGLDEEETHVQHGRAAIAALEMRFERLQQTAEHERQRLEPLDRPLEIERLLEALLGHGRHERSGILTAREPLPSHARLPETRGHIVGRQRREIAERAQTPAFEDTSNWNVERSESFGRWALGVGN